MGRTMPANEPALLLVTPGLTIEQLIAQVIGSGAPKVQLLVSDGSTTFHPPDAAERLKAIATVRGIDLVVIGSDEKTLHAVQRSGLATLAVTDARVAAPSAPPKTRAREAKGLAVGTRPNTALPQTTQRKKAAPIARDDAAFLRSLEQGQARPAPSSAFADELDRPALPGPAQSDTQRRTATRSPSLPPAPPSDTQRRQTQAAAQRARSAHDEVVAIPQGARAKSGSTAASITRPMPATGTSPVRSHPGRALQPARQYGGGSGATAALPRPGSYDEEVEEQGPRRPWLLVGVMSALIVILLAIGIALFLPTLERVNVVVALPVPPEESSPFDNLPIAINPVGAPASDSAVTADTVGGEVRFTSSGSITTSVLTPVGSAGGIVTLRNSSAQALPFPPGTEFVAFNDVGQEEVRFVANDAFTVPEATTSDQGAQIITTRGQIQVAVVARAPGSASNVGANSIQQMIVPGQGPINVAGGNPQAIHDPLLGGTEEEVFLVKDSDVQPVLADALTGLDRQAREEMSAAAAGRGLSLEPTTVRPDAALFAQMQGFESSVTPPPGQAVDPTNPSFTVEVWARYSALAAPSGNGLATQLQQAVPGLLRQTGRLGQCQKAEITGWSWDGALLTAAGRVVPDMEDRRCNQEQLDVATAQQIRDAIRGKPRAEAIAALDALVARGVIASYQLPEVEQIPARDGQITVGLR
jgi:hypothetical protein